jgi:hypothetical protein
VVTGGTGPTSAAKESDGARVARVIAEAWREHRLVSRLFAAADELRTDDPSVGATFAAVHLAPAELLSNASNDHLWRDLGRDLAIGEVRDLYERLAQSCERRPRQPSLRRQISDILSRLNPGPRSGAILSPPRTEIFDELEVRRPPDRSDSRALDSVWFRGTFESVPMFSVPMTPVWPLWVIDFDRLGEMRRRGAADEIEITIEPHREGLVRYGDTMVPGVAITMRQYVDIEIARPASAVGIDTSEGDESEAD